MGKGKMGNNLRITSTCRNKKEFPLYPWQATKDALGSSRIKTFLLPDDAVDLVEPESK